MAYNKPSELPKNFGRMLADAETAEKADVLRRETGAKIKPFGFDEDLDQKENPVYPMLQKVLGPEVRSDIIRQLIGGADQAVKVKSLWENYLPKPLTPAESVASDNLLKDPNLSWGAFLNDPVIEKALVENVLYRFLGDLSKAGSFADNAEKVLEDWKKQAPGNYAAAEVAVDDYMATAYRTVKDPNNAEALAAIKQTRMLSHCMLHAHITGHNTFHLSPELGGTASQTITLNSPTLEKLSNTNRPLYFQLARMEVGSVKKADYNTKPPEQARALKQFLGMQAADNRNPYEVLYDRLVEETNPKSMLFERGDMKYSVEHCIAQISRTISPILSLDVQKLRQKNMEPSKLFTLYKLSRKVHQLDIGSVYPLLGTGMLPQGMPPDFELRFDPAWMKTRSVVSVLTPATLATAGFNPIVHRGLKDIVGQIGKMMPDMMGKLEASETLQFLKRAQTRDVLVEPVRIAIMQREFTRAFRSSMPEKYYEISLNEMRQLDPVRFASVSLEEFTKQGESTWFNKNDAKDKSVVRFNVYKAAIRAVGQNPEAPAMIEAAMMQSRSYNVMELRVAPEWRGVFPHQPSPQVNYSGVRPPQGGKLVAFEPGEYRYLEREKVAHPVLSIKHFNGLCDDGKSGVLSAEMVALQGIYTTANPAVTTHAYCCGHPSMMEKQARYCSVLTREAEDTGILLLPYPHLDHKPGDLREHAERIRTVRTQPKYLSALAEALKTADLDANPLYYCSLLTDPKALKAWGDMMIVKAAKEAGISTEKASELGWKTLDKLQFNRFEGGVQNTSLPVFAIEGEKKSLAVMESQLRQFKHALGRVFAAEDPMAALAQEKAPQIVIPIGTIGVWNTIKTPGTDKHELNPAIARQIPLKGRTFIIAQDADGKNNPSVTTAAAFAATIIKQHGGETFYWKPPPGPGKGFDDFVEATALQLVAEKGLAWKQAVDESYAQVPEQLLPNIRKMRLNLSYKDITKAQAEGWDLQKFITEDPKVPQSLPGLG